MHQEPTYRTVFYNTWVDKDKFREMFNILWQTQASRLCYVCMYQK